MKNTIRIFAVLLAVLLLLPCFAACEKNEPTENGPAAQTNPGERTDGTPGASGTGPSQNAGTEPGQPAGTEPEYPMPDYSDFVMPKATGELNIYVDATMGKAVMDPAIQIFKELYPDVAVTYTVVSMDEFSTRIETELPAGKGPDLLFFLGAHIPDIYKTMETGLFSDLNPYFLNDPDISLDEFVAGAMKGGTDKGRQFFVPVCYNARFMVARRSTLNKLGIEDPSEIGSFLEAGRLFKEAYPDGSLFMDDSTLETYVTNLYWLESLCGIRFVDYENDTAECDGDLLKQAMDLVKLYYDPDYIVDDPAKSDRNTSNYKGVDCLMRNDCLYNDSDTGYHTFSKVCKTLAAEGDEAVAFLVRGADNKALAELVQMAAIPQGSKNKLNAWRLMKILLSDEIQSARDESRFGNSIFWSGQPVRLSSLRKKLEYDVSYWECDLEDETEKKIFDEYVALLSSPTDARILPTIISRYIRLELMPYIRGEKGWDDCYKSFLNTLELYASE